MALFCCIASASSLARRGQHAIVAPSALQAHRHRALPALCRDRHPVGSRLADLPFHRKAEGSRPPARRASCRRSGLADAHLDEHGYVYATIPANTAKKVPVICFCSHMDTSPDCTGANVKPQIVRNYRGGDIVLPGDPAQVIRAAEHPGAGQPDRQRHRHHRRHHPARRRQQGRRRRDHGRGAIPDEQPADQARHHQDPVHARRGDRPRRRQGRPEEARRRFRLHHRRRDRRHTSRTRRSPPTAPPSRSRASAPIPALPRAGWSMRSRSRPPSSTGCRKIPARRRPPRAAKASCIRSACPARWRARRSSLIVRDFTEQGLKQKEALLESHRQGRDEGLSALDLQDRDQAAVPQHESR